LIVLDLVRLNHINSVVRNFDAGNAFYTGVFGADKYWEGYDEGAERDASLLVIGSTPIELFSPRTEASQLGQSLSRYGEGFHSFELQVTDLAEAHEIFERAGVRFTTDRPDSFFMTHPKDGFGLLFEICAIDMNGDPRLVEGFSDQPWRDGPLGLDRMNCLQIVTDDVEAASKFYAGITGGPTIYDTTRPGLGRAVGVWAADFIMEFAQPDDDDSVWAAHLRRPGPRMRAINFKVTSLDAARAHLESHGLRVLPGDTDADILLDPADNFGVRYQFSEQSLPDDPRD
jgi:catechol 2,3-dioxygenase-like lactoylglutathione lyase family enzyme